MSTTHTIPENELNHLWRTIKSYPKMIALLTLLAFVLSSIYAFYIHKPVYEARVLMQEGKLNTALVEPIKQLNLKLSSKYLIDPISDKNMPKLNKMKLFSYANGVIRLTAKGYNKEEIKTYLENIIHEISLEHYATIEKYSNDYNKSLQTSIQNVTDTEQELVELKKEIKNNEKVLKEGNLTDQNSANLRMIKIINDGVKLEHLNTQLTKFKASVRNYQTVLRADRTFQTHMINQVIIEPNAINASKRLIITIATVAGLLFSILLAYMLSLIANKRD